MPVLELENNVGLAWRASVLEYINNELSLPDQ